MSAKRPPDHLLAQQLRTEGAHAENVSDGVGVPALRQHGNRNDAAGLAAEPPCPSDGVHRLAKQVLIGEGIRPAAVASAHDDLAAKAVYFVGGGGAESAVQGFAGFELPTVNEERARSAERIAVIVEIAEQREAAVLEGRGAVGILAEEAGNVVVDELRGRYVVADHDEAWRNLDAGFPPYFERLPVVSIESFERGLQFDGNAQRIERGGITALLFRHLLADMVPEIAELGHLAPGDDVVGHRHARQFDDAAFDRVHQREVARCPREKRAFCIA